MRSPHDGRRAWHGPRARWASRPTAVSWRTGSGRASALSLRRPPTAACPGRYGPICVVVETDRDVHVGNYDSWWDVAVAEVAEDLAVVQARAEYEAAKQEQRHYL